MTYLINFEKAEKEDIDLIRKALSKSFLLKNGKMPNTSLFARALLLYVMSKFYGEADVELCFDSRGKPYLKNSLYKISISHSKSFALISISEKEVGCDVQEIVPCNMKVAKRHFTEKESLYLEKSENPDEDFTALWCLKESALKNTGEGLSGGLSTYDFADSLKKEYFEKFDMCFTLKKYGGACFSVCGFTGKEGFKEIELSQIKEIYN
ncbi:MAG: 4'-phosphopantetheinyl transferase family protein [Acutalibacteraceae bacterium]